MSGVSEIQESIIYEPVSPFSGLRLEASANDRPDDCNHLQLFTFQHIHGHNESTFGGSPSVALGETPDV